MEVLRYYETSGFHGTTRLYNPEHRSLLMPELGSTHQFLELWWRVYISIQEEEEELPSILKLKNKTKLRGCSP
jgi:hypothetical protein